MKNIILFFFCLFFIQELSAHEGPPYPILVDHTFSPHKLSIWADPDTGEGTFLFYLESSEPLTDLSITLKAHDPNQAGSALVASAQINPGDKKQSSRVISYIAKVPFTHEALWNVEFTLQDKSGILTTKTIPVDVTPPGPSRTEALIYLIPFILIGVIWIRVILFKRKKA